MISEATTQQLLTLPQTFNPCMAVCSPQIRHVLLGREEYVVLHDLPRFVVVE